MKVLLTKKLNGARQPIETAEIDGECLDYFFDQQFEHLNESKLSSSLPQGFLPCKPKDISIMVEDHYSYESQRVISTKSIKNLSEFKNYDNELDKYTLELCRY